MIQHRLTAVSKYFGKPAIFHCRCFLKGFCKRFFFIGNFKAEEFNKFLNNSVSLTLTSIVIGDCVDALALSLVIMIYRKYKTINADEVRRIRG